MQKPGHVCNTHTLPKAPGEQWDGIYAFFMASPRLCCPFLRTPAETGAFVLHAEVMDGDGITCVASDS